MKRNIPDKCCANCEFLIRVQTIEAEPESQERLVPLSDGERIGFHQGHLPEQLFCGTRDTYSAFRCARNVWNEHRIMMDVRQVLTKDRSESCFFYPCSDGISLDAATELERRAVDRREAERDRALTRDTAKSARRASWAAITVAVLSGVFNVAWRYF